jgi:nucleotide-binding universal stress UspA family protein
MEIFPTRVLLATDGSEEAILAERAAARLATTRDSELHVVHVGEFLPTFLAQTEVEPARIEREAKELLEERAARIEAGGKAVARTHLRLGAADREIVAVAEELEADLIVLGSRGRGGIRRALMGSVSDSVVRHAHCPVMVVRPERE